MSIHHKGISCSELDSSACSQCPCCKAGKGGVFKGRALKDAIDILVMSRAGAHTRSLFGSRKHFLWDGG